MAPTDTADSKVGTPLIPFKDWVISQRKTVGVPAWDGKALPDVAQLDLAFMSFRLQVDRTLTSTTNADSLSAILDAIGIRMEPKTQVCLLRLYAEYLTENPRRLTADDMDVFCERAKKLVPFMPAMVNVELTKVAKQLREAKDLLYDKGVPPSVNWGDID